MKKGLNIITNATGRRQTEIMVRSFHRHHRRAKPRAWRTDCRRARCHRLCLRRDCCQKSCQNMGMCALINNFGLSHQPGANSAGQLPRVAHVDHVRYVFETNAFGVIALTSAFLPFLRW